MKQYKLILFLGLILFILNNLKAEVVSISGRQILVNNSIYTIKGICYHPVSKGSSTVSFSNLNKDLALMKEAGINTIRVYLPITERAVLDQIQASGLKVIIGFGYNQDGKFDILSGTFADYIKNYKDHPAILFWELGNEYNYHPEWFGGAIENWYRALNDAAEKIHQIDPTHPVATAHGELPDAKALSLCRNVDVWGMNVYRWDNPEEIFSQWEAVSYKPMYLSEAGADSYMAAKMNGYELGENEKAQADATRNILDDIFRFRDICSGVAIFSFADEWWKAGNNGQQDVGGWAPKSSGVPYDGAANEEYWGIVKIDATRKLAFGVLKEKYSNLTEPKMMTYILKNKNLEIKIDAPLANYNFSRFDWTGKIVSVKYKDIPVSTAEKLKDENENQSGKGFYNEFGIEAAIGYDETDEGNWFQKIGVGLLKKEQGDYFFGKSYEIQPAEFQVTVNPDKIKTTCNSQNINGYSYLLTKEIKLLENGFVIHYKLKNTGNKTIETNEYCHNFVAIDNELIGSNYILKFPFQIDPERFDATVNPERKVEIGSNEFSFNGTPSEPFYFSKLSGGQNVVASWEIINKKTRIGIRETGSFKTSKVKLWGTTHVISPELFFEINVKPGKDLEWSRTYQVFEIN